MKPNKKAVAERLQSIRNDLGWSIPMMAEKVGATSANLGSYLRGLALPPEEVIQNISKLTNYPEEWIYYGDVREYILSVLSSYGYNTFLEDYPDTIEQVYFECDKQNVYPLINSYPHERSIIDVFYGIYTPIFNEYVNKTIEKYAIEISKYPLYTGSVEYNQQKFLSRVRGLIRWEIPQIKYGDDERILTIAEDEFKNRVDFYFRTHRKTLKEIIGIERDPLFFPYIIEKLSTNKGTNEIITYLAHMTKQGFDTGSEIAREVTDAFKGLGSELEKISKKYSKREIERVFPKEEE